MQQLLCCCCWRARTVGRPVFGCLKIPRTHAASEEKKVDREASLSNHKTGAHDTGTHKKKHTHTKSAAGRVAAIKPQRRAPTNLALEKILKEKSCGRATVYLARNESQTRSKSELVVSAVVIHLPLTARRSRADPLPPTRPLVGPAATAPAPRPALPPALPPAACHATRHPPRAPRVYVPAPALPRAPPAYQ